MKKKILIITLLLLVIGLTACSRPEYSRNINWKMSDEEFIDEYSIYCMDVIDEVLHDLEINLVFSVENMHDDKFDIDYQGEDMSIEFNFKNDGSVAYYSVNLIMFNFTETTLTDLSTVLVYLEFIDEVTEALVYDYQGGVYVYEDLLENLRNDENNTLTYYFDDGIGKVGYWVTSGDSYSQTEDRDYVSFRYQGLLRRSEPVDVWD